MWEATGKRRIGNPVETSRAREIDGVFPPEQAQFFVVLLWQHGVLQP